MRHLRAENKSEATITAYWYAVYGLDQFLTSKGMPRDVGAITREYFEAYIADQLQTRSPATAQ